MKLGKLHEMHLESIIWNQTPCVQLCCACGWKGTMWEGTMWEHCTIGKLDTSETRTERILHLLENIELELVVTQSSL